MHGVSTICDFLTQSFQNGYQFDPMTFYTWMHPVRMSTRRTVRICTGFTDRARLSRQNIRTQTVVLQQIANKIRVFLMVGTCGEGFLDIGDIADLCGCRNDQAGFKLLAGFLTLAHIADSRRASPGGSVHRAFVFAHPAYA